MKIAICDDEAGFIAPLRKEIDSYAITRNVDVSVDEFRTTDELNPVCRNYDIIFLDIRFNGKNIGIEWAKKIRNDGNRTLIVIYSSLRGEAINSLHAEPIRFILKPVSTESVFEALDICCKKLAENDKQIHIKSDFDDVLISMSDIVYIESGQRHRKFVLYNGTEIITGESLKSIYEKLDKKRFAYCHQSFIVQIFKVRRIEQYTLYLTTGARIPLSRNLVTEFKYAILTFAGEQM
ncbi:MAG: LytTR family DNA-binding domain-containing protein [Oscillospiraceae bacterium]